MISQKLIGRPGKKHTEATKALISQKLLGKPKSVPQSEEQRTKLSLRQIGSNNVFFGKTHTPEVVELLRQKALNRKTSNSPSYVVT